MSPRSNPRVTPAAPPPAAPTAAPLPACPTTAPPAAPAAAPMAAPAPPLTAASFIVSPAPAPVETYCSACSIQSLMSWSAAAFPARFSESFGYRTGRCEEQATSASEKKTLMRKSRFVPMSPSMFLLRISVGGRACKLGPGRRWMFDPGRSRQVHAHLAARFDKGLRASKVADKTSQGESR